MSTLFVFVFKLIPLLFCIRSIEIQIYRSKPCHQIGSGPLSIKPVKHKNLLSTYTSCLTKTCYHLKVYIVAIGAPYFAAQRNLLCSIFLINSFMKLGLGLSYELVLRDIDIRSALLAVFGIPSYHPPPLTTPCLLLTRTTSQGFLTQQATLTIALSPPTTEPIRALIDCHGIL